MDPSTRREFLRAASVLGAAAGLAGCAGAAVQSAPAEARAAGFVFTPDEARRLAEARPDFEIVTRGSVGSVVLRRKTRPVPAGLDLTVVAARMERTMLAANGVGIAGPQVGLGLRIATLKLDYKSEHPRIVFVRNPVIVERSDDALLGYEGCLSVPGVGGLVRRSRWIRVEHESADGALAVSEAEGYNAVLWQHELDHLDGFLYLDHLQGELLPMDEVRRLRKEAEEREKAKVAPDGTTTTPGAGPPTPQSRNQDFLEGAVFLLS